VIQTLKMLTPMVSSLSFLKLGQAIFLSNTKLRPRVPWRTGTSMRPDQYDEWLHCPDEEAPGFVTRYPSERLVTHAAPKPSQKTLSGTLPDV
jgi:hypothetical protein